MPPRVRRETLSQTSSSSRLLALRLVVVGAVWIAWGTVQLLGVESAGHRPLVKGFSDGFLVGYPAVGVDVRRQAHSRSPSRIVRSASVRALSASNVSMDLLGVRVATEVAGVLGKVRYRANDVVDVGTVATSPSGFEG